MLWRWILQNLTDKIVWDDYKAINGERVNSLSASCLGVGGFCSWDVAHACEYWQAKFQNPAHKILETAQSPNSYFHFLFDLGFDLGLGLGLVKSLFRPSLFLIPQWPLLASLYLSEVWTLTLKNTLTVWVVSFFLLKYISLVLCVNMYLTLNF